MDGSMGMSINLGGMNYILIDCAAPRNNIRPTVISSISD